MRNDTEMNIVSISGTSPRECSKHITEILFSPEMTRDLNVKTILLQKVFKKIVNDTTILSEIDPFYLSIRYYFTIGNQK